MSAELYGARFIWCFMFATLAACVLFAGVVVIPIVNLADLSLGPPPLDFKQLCIRDEVMTEQASEGPQRNPGLSAENDMPREAGRSQR